MRNAKYWIEKLRLEPHPEGGYFRQTYKAELTVVRGPTANGCEVASTTGVDGVELRRSGTARPASTAIYFLLEGENFSAFHRLRSDEIWHFYAGSPLMVHMIDLGGQYWSIELGNDPERGEVFQATVPAGCWFASHVKDWKGWALAGCTVAPGFEFEDFELAKREELIAKYPEHREIVRKLARAG